MNDWLSKLKPNVIIQGDMFPDPVEILVVNPFGNSVKLTGRNTRTNAVIEQIIDAAKAKQIIIETPDTDPFDGNALKFRLAIEGMRLGLAYEYDPYFTLSIARIDPLPHQLEAVYDYFLKLPRIRFLLADDPGAGKTIMAGLLIKELKIRGLVKRILIVAPANLTFQWQRELKDKFKEDFKVVRGDVLRTNYGINPWQENNQLVTSVSWVSYTEDANESLLRSNWDLIIVDEAHKMNPRREGDETGMYRLGEELSKRTDHFLLMTATPHKGDSNNFSRFLKLLDSDVYADSSSLDKAMEKHEAPFYLRRVKEALVTFPDPETGVVKSLFTKRNVETVAFEIGGDEWDFYNELTNYVERQSIKAAADDSARGRALGFTMAMLQRRFASSLYAIRRSLERMRDKRELILRDPEAYRQEQIAKRLPDNFEDLPDDEQQRISETLEAVVASYDPIDLREEIGELTRLIDHARGLEKREIETKLTKLKALITDQGIFKDPSMKLLIFTEHKDTLDYLVGDGKDNRPYGKLREWGLTVTQIHGGMKIGNRNTPNTRIYSELEFREDCQVMVATEAAGEGINLQFCWLMINYDIPWNPIRLEQRMGRIHRYGQEKDCLIFNFVITNTREGRVLAKLFERIKSIEADLDPNKTGKVFNVIGEVFPSNELERMIRKMYARNLSEDVIKDRIVEEIDTEHFKKITHSTLEGLAKRELNLSAILRKSAEAKEKRLVPEVIEDFFLQSSSYHGVSAKKSKQDHVFTIGKVPRNLWQLGDELEPKFGKLGREYGEVTFSSEHLKQNQTLEWVTPGHILFECIREKTLDTFQKDLKRGAVFYDIHLSDPIRLDVFSASVKDGRGNTLHKRLFVLETLPNGNIFKREPTIFLDINPCESLEGVEIPKWDGLPTTNDLEQYLYENQLQKYLDEVSKEREREITMIESHVEISLNTLIDRANRELGDLIENQLYAANSKKIEDKILELTDRLERRRSDLAKERQCSIQDIRHIGSAWVLPHPERSKPEIKNMVSDANIEKIAINAVIEYENRLGYQVQSVEADNRGFDLISRKPHPEDPQTAIDVKFIEVKGRSQGGQVALTANEYRTAQRLKQDYFLYVVYNCSTNPEIHIIRDPAKLSWEPIVKVEHYQLPEREILKEK